MYILEIPTPDKFYYFSVNPSAIFEYVNMRTRARRYIYTNIVFLYDERRETRRRNIRCIAGAGVYTHFVLVDVKIFQKRIIQQFVWIDVNRRLPFADRAQLPQRVQHAPVFWPCKQRARSISMGVLVFHAVLRFHIFARAFLPGQNVCAAQKRGCYAPYTGGHASYKRVFGLLEIGCTAKYSSGHGSESPEERLNRSQQIDCR